MKRTLATLILFACIGFSYLSAQTTIGNDIRVYTETEGPFTLYVDGQAVNEEPQTSVTLENYPGEFGKVKVVLESGDSKEMQVQFSMPNCKPCYTVYKVKRKKKNNKLVIRTQAFSQKTVVTNPIIVVPADGN